MPAPRPARICRQLNHGKTPGECYPNHSKDSCRGRAPRAWTSSVSRNKVNGRCFKQSGYPLSSPQHKFLAGLIRDQGLEWKAAIHADANHRAFADQRFHPPHQSVPGTVLAERRALVQDHVAGMNADIDLPIEAGRGRGDQLGGSNPHGSQTIAHGNDACPLDCVHPDDAGDREIGGFAEDILDGTALPDASLIENDDEIRQGKRFDRSCVTSIAGIPSCVSERRSSPRSCSRSGTSSAESGSSSNSRRGRYDR
jgi:hypothetical protein